jgi:hypothetical protein
MRSLLAVLVLLLCWATPALANSSATATTPLQLPRSPGTSPLFVAVLEATAQVPGGESDADAEPAVAVKQRSEGKALRLSLFSTVAPIATGVILIAAGSSSSSALQATGGIMMLAGGLLGPSVGHFYAANAGQAMLGIGMRSLAFGVGTVAAYAIILSDDGTGFILAYVAFIGGAAVTVAWAIYDIVDAPKSAERYNEKSRSARIRLTPIYFAAESAPGIAVQLEF